MEATGTDDHRPTPRRAWKPYLLLLAALAAAAAAFVGYGQSELLLEAVNLRYCG